jgi:hypothetical protein
MHNPRLLIGLFLGLSAFALAATFAPSGMVRFYGDSTLTNLTTGAVYFNTSNSTFWAGGSTSNPVKVGDAAWSNSVTASITNDLVTGLTTNLSLLDSTTNAVTLIYTNGLLKGVQ